MKNTFIFCGCVGWCLEIAWTGLHALFDGKYQLMGRSSLWMFPIYGCAAIIGPLSRIYRNFNIFVRGMIYMVHIFSGEYLFGYILKKFQMCPWNYSHCQFHIDGLIRLDYAPLWFLTGLFYERLLTSTKTGASTLKH